MSIHQLIDELAAKNISASRKSLYDDIRLLREAGMDIRMNSDYGYYLAKHHFTLTEMRLLTDAVHSARFLSAEMCHQLIHKLGLLASSNQRKQLSRRLLSRNRSFYDTTDCFASIKRIYEAIRYNRQVSFLCFRITPEKKLFLYNRAQPYVVSPWDFLWHNNHYYLICYRHDGHRLEYFRTDRIMDVKILTSCREGGNLFREIDLQRFQPEEVAGACPGSFHGVTLRCANHLSGAVMERFGRDVMMVPDWNGTFTAAVKTTLGPRFYAWIFGYGNEIEILSPKQAVLEMRSMLRKAGSLYGMYPAPPSDKGD
ncbi:helix-turn-helix transcriptional regulator [Ructibacterium gallinarum]|uniref:WYL domain-containing protein n=1 Tax=Ructibacterium gallinarum TaxID=2779355 RepID=A0A9D5M3U0_9FIRM|nr:WYL domain-containing protein [Ructibacterium gallinarum]MBE5040184.1 WYL domain-containing protein [Ructibacterium gallinarum]